MYIAFNQYIACPDSGLWQSYESLCKTEGDYVSRKKAFSSTINEFFYGYLLTVQYEILIASTNLVCKIYFFSVRSKLLWTDDCRGIFSLLFLGTVNF